MNVELPTTGCNISNSSGYIDNYSGNIRTRYLINENKLVKVYSTTYATRPSDYICLSTGDLVYKPELAIYFQFISAIMILIATVILFKITIGRLLK